MSSLRQTMHEVMHFRAPAAGVLKDILAPRLNDAQMKASELIEFGAVYINKTREFNPEASVPAEAYIRVHSRPRRFPLAAKTDWKKRLVHVCDDFVILNKPGGMPVHASLDNAIETCVAAVSREVGSEVHALHRLDVPTHGLLVLGRSSAFNTHFCSLLREHSVRKEYLALVYHPPPLGLMIHYMKQSERSPKIVSKESKGEGWQECKLIVKNVVPFPQSLLSPRVRRVIAAQTASQAAAVHPPPLASPQPQSLEVDTYEVRIELLTGRTHQIRAQLSHEGCHLVGDEMYRRNAPQGEELDDDCDAANAAAGDAAADDPDVPDAFKCLAREMEVEGTLALQAVLVQFPPPALDDDGRALGQDRAAKPPKLSKRQRREERLREANAKAEEQTASATCGNGGDHIGGAQGAGTSASTAGGDVGSGPSAPPSDALAGQENRGPAWQRCAPAELLLFEAPDAWWSLRAVQDCE